MGIMFSYNKLNVNSLNFLSMNNEELKIRLQLINVNSNELLFYSYAIDINKYGGSCKNINGPYAKLCAPYVIKKVDVKVLNVMSITNKARNI